MFRPMDEDEVITLLRAEASKCASMTRYAKANGFTVQYLSDVFARKRQPGPRILEALGLRRQVKYVEVEPEPVG